MQSTRKQVSLRSVLDNYSRLADKYKPLTVEQERALIAAERHDEEHLRDLLIYHNISAALFIAKKYGRPRIDTLDDAMQRAMVGLYEASRAFDFDRNNRFLTYAAWRIIRNVQYPSYLLSFDMDARTMSMDEPLSMRVSSMDGDKIAGRDALRGVIQDEEEDVVNNESDAISKLNEEDWRTIVLKIVDTCIRFSESNREIFKRYLELGEKQLVAQEYGISRERVRQIVSKVLGVVLLKLGKYSDDEEIARRLENFGRCEDEDEDERRPEKRRKAARAATRSQAEKERVEEKVEVGAVETIAAAEAVETVQAIDTAEGFTEAPEQRPRRRTKMTSFNLICLRTGVTKYDRIDCTRQRKARKMWTNWRPEGFERYLNDMYAHKRRASAAPTCVEAVEDLRDPEMPLVSCEDGEADQYLFADEMDARLARFDEHQIANGNHSDDVYELQDAN